MQPRYKNLVYETATVLEVSYDEVAALAYRWMFTTTGAWPARRLFVVERELAHVRRHDSSPHEPMHSAVRRFCDAVICGTVDKIQLDELRAVEMPEEHFGAGRYADE